MKFNRALFATTLSALSSVQAVNTTVPAVVTVTTTQSPLEAAESALEQAKYNANLMLQIIIQDDSHWDEYEHSEDQIDREVTEIIAVLPNTTQHWVKERTQELKDRKRMKTGMVRIHSRSARLASKAYKHAARQLESLRIRAGVPERIYKRDFERDEESSEGMEDQAENYGDAAESHVEAFYDLVKDELERRNEEQEEASAQQQVHHARRQQHTGQGSDADVPANPALNLMAVGPSAVNDGQGFLLTFACVGFLASMVVAVQVGGRSSVEQGLQPLLRA